MKKSKILRSIYSLFTIALAISLSAIAAFSQEEDTEGLSVTSINVEFTSASTISRERVISNIRTAPGQPFSQAVIEQDIRNLYGTGEISNVQVYAEPADNGVAVTMLITPRTVVGEVLIQGATQISEKRLRKELTVKPGETLKQEQLEVDRQKILELYSDKGYSGVEVDYNESRGADGRTNVTYNIIEGTKTKIGIISFEGNTIFSSRELQKLLKTKRSNILSPFTKDGKIDDLKLLSDRRAIAEAYQDKGYLDAVVTEVRQEPFKGNSMRLVFVISEGIQYIVGNISVDGFTRITNERAVELFGVKPGELYRPKRIEAGLKSLRDQYGAQGYVDFDPGFQTISAGQNVVGISLDAKEGAPSRVGNVNITGNVKTRDKVIRREVPLAPGDLFNTTLVDNARRRIQNTALFEKVDAYPEDTGIQGQKDLTINVEEKRTGQLSFGAGFSSIDSLIGFAEISQGNFDVSNWPNFTGAGQKLRLRGVFGLERQDAQFSFVEPWFLNRQLALGLEAYYREAQYLSDVYDLETLGGAISLNTAVGEYSSLKFEYRIEDIQMTKLDKNATEQFVRSAQEDGVQSQLKLLYSYDRRDSAILTRRGFRFDASAFVMGSFLGGEQESYGLSAEAWQYFHLPGDTIFLINAEAATIDSTGSSSFIPVYNRLYLGGANTLRGFKYRDVGPKDEKGEPVGGHTMVRFTLEYTFPIISRVRGAVFYDLGAVSEDAFDFGGDLNSNIGAGLRLDLPIGPIRLDVGFPIQTDEFNDSGARFNFNVGWQF